MRSHEIGTVASLFSAPITWRACFSPNFVTKSFDFAVLVLAKDIPDTTMAGLEELSCQILLLLFSHHSVLLQEGRLGKPPHSLHFFLCHCSILFLVHGCFSIFSFESRAFPQFAVLPDPDDGGDDGGAAQLDEGGRGGGGAAR